MQKLNRSQWPKIAVVFLLLALLVGAAARLRFEELGFKPLHADESEQAYKLGELLSGAGYRYDPNDHHGPVMYYVAEVFAKLAGETRFSELTADVLRTPQALAGIALVLLPVLLWRRLGRGEKAQSIGGISGSVVLLAAAFAAFSPVAVYYSRYFIQEIIFTATFWFCAALLWRAWFARGSAGGGGAAGDAAGGAGTAGKRGLLLAAIAGVLFGLTVALKETWVLMLPALVLALVVAGGDRLVARWRAWRSNGHCVFPALLFAGIAFLTAEAFFSSFGQHWRGVEYSFTTFLRYVHRAGGEGHEKPLLYYAPLLFNPKPLLLDLCSVFGAKTWALKNGLGPFTGVREIFAGVGALLALGLLPVRELWNGAERRFAVFALVNTAVLLVLYSLIAYKNPWLVVGILPTLWLAGAFGVVAFARLVLRVKKRAVRLGALAALTFTGALLFVAQWNSAKLLSRRLGADEERNPLAYVHTTDALARIEQRAAQLAASGGDAAPVFALSYTAEYWPLPWYLRKWEFGADGKKRVGFWRGVPRGNAPLDARGERDAAGNALYGVPIVITDPTTEAAVAPRLRGDYTPAEDICLREGYPVYVRYRRDLLGAKNAVVEPSKNASLNSK